MEDTDAGGVVYHSNYLKYMERARTEFIEELGVSKSKILGDNLIFVVRKISISYKSPACLDELLEVSAEISELNKYAATFSQNIVRLSDNKLLCSAEVQVVCVNRAKSKLTTLPEGLAKYVNSGASLD